MHRITNPELIKHLHDNIPKSVDEMMRVTTTFLKGEVAASNQVRKKTLPAWKQQEAGRRNFFERMGDFRNQQRSKRRRDKFTLLTKSQKKILALDKGKFKTLPPMTTPVEKRNNNKFFPRGRDEEGTEGPMITEAEIGGHFIHRIYVDGGLASEILYEYCFNRLRPEVKNQMVPATTPLIGFSGEIIWLMGQIFLQVKIEDAEHSTSTWMNFVVVRSPSQYNGIIGRPGVRKIQAVPSTAHEMLKFPVLGGILTLRSSKIIPLECTMVSKLEAQPSSITQATEERIRVAIHPKYPEQTIAIGFTPSPNKRKTNGIVELLSAMATGHICLEI
ncbi:hypothetical protein Tco_0933475 [Tanacetum coccineum]